MASYQDDPSGDARPVPARFGKFEVLGHLATGGMAEIYLARLAGLDDFDASNAVVVKRLLPELTTSPTFVTMFRDDLTRFLDTWLPRFEAEGRSYVTICIGCTGGRHRSVYLAEQLSEHFRATHRQVLSYHRELE